MWWHVVMLMLGLVGCGGGAGRPDAATASSEPMHPPIRTSMAALHAGGGVPPGWMLTPARGDATRGRVLFAHYGCHACHLAGPDTFADGAQDETDGPALTGMGAHHPPAYFVETILSPSAVLVEGPGWASASGRSTMPAYPDMTIADLTDLVAYLGSLTDAGAHDHAAMMAAAQASARRVPRPAPPDAEAGVFFVQRYDVRPGELEAFERWFASTGRDALFTFEGLTSIDTYVQSGEGPSVTTVFAFRDDAALRGFLDDPRAEELGEAFDAFIGPHDHQTFRVPPIHRAPSLSARRPH